MPKKTDYSLITFLVNKVLLRSPPRSIHANRPACSLIERLTPNQEDILSKTELGKAGVRSITLLHFYNLFSKTRKFWCSGTQMQMQKYTFWNLKTKSKRNEENVKISFYISCYWFKLKLFLLYFPFLWKILFILSALHDMNNNFQEFDFKFN